MLVQSPTQAAVLCGLAIVAAATVWYLAVQARWFSVVLGCTRLRAAGIALLGYLLSLAIFVVAGLLISLAARGPG